MTQPNNELPPLKNIEKSGTYNLRLCRPKDDKLAERFKKNKKEFASCRLFFVDDEGNCMTKNFSVEFGKGLAMVIGKFSGKFAEVPPTDMSVDALLEFCNPAFGKKASVELEVTPDKEWQGKMQFNYRMNKISPVKEQKKVNDVPSSFSSEADDAIPF